MSRTRTPAIRLWLALVLALVVPLQGALAALVGVAGTRHAHVVRDASGAERGTTLILDDVRRGARAADRPAHVAGTLLHAHATTERHVHAGRDDLRLAAGEVSPADDDGAAGAASALGSAALVSDASTGLPESGARHLLAGHRGWSSLVHDSEPLERPPRRG